jgi:serine-type D-Ala-D-Ala carboxypeptidase
VHVKTTPDFARCCRMRCEALDRVAATVVESNAAPAASCAVAFRANNRWEFGVGAAGTLWPNSTASASPDTVFDLASLTKPVVAVAAATESARGRLDWNAPIQTLLPELHGLETGKMTIDLLLSHRAGLVPHVELFLRHRAGRSFEINELLVTAARARLRDCRSDATPSQAVYSDLGYLLVGAAIERRYGVALDRWLTSRIPELARKDLGSARMWHALDDRFHERCAPTEIVPWRGGLLLGRVHDENAWVLAGFGLCGHAGLFGTAFGVAAFGAAVLDALQGRMTGIPEAAAHVTTHARLGGTYCAGFDRKSAEGSTAGQVASPETFGHLGYTGTSFWCDRNRSAVTVLLSNRVCPSRNNIALRAMRARVHDSLFEWSALKQLGRST